MSKRPVDLLLDDIVLATGRIEQYIKDLSFDAFSREQKTIDAVVRNLEIIWQILHKDLPEFRDTLSQIID